MLSRSLAMLRTKREQLPSRKHGNVPLCQLFGASDHLAEASPEEIAAILAAIAAATPTAVVEDAGDDTLHEWVHAARLRSHRAGLSADRGACPDASDAEAAHDVASPD